MHESPTERFTDRAEHYARHRPTYPEEVVAILQERCGLTPTDLIVDVGSGTGLLSATLLRNGNRVYGVEPNAAMRREAERLLADQPGFVSVGARAEATTLPDACADLVTVGQALHWFEPQPTRREFRRILRPGGWLVVVNNRRREDSALMQAVEPVLNAARRRPEEGQGRWEVTEEALAAYYGPGGFEAAECANRQVLDEAGYLGLWLSRSTTPGPGQPGHEELMERLRAIFREHQRDGTVMVEYATRVCFGRLTD